MKERVNVAKRPLKDGVISLFLDYRVNGKRKRENLKLYLVKERTPMDKAKNAETMRIANSVRDDRAFELEQLEAGVEVKARPRIVNFVDYAENYGKKYTKATTIINFKALVNKVRNFQPDVTLQEMNENWFKRFSDHLRDIGNCNNTIRKHVKAITYILEDARYNGLLNHVPKVSKFIPKEEPAIRVFLTLDEVKKLIETECESEMIKNAFLFSCFTGLRWSDIANLKNSNFVGTDIVIRQEKTSTPVIVPMTENACRFLPKDYKERQFIFDIYNRVRTNLVIKNWVKAAGIEKHVTYHSSRHTFATILYSHCNDIFATSKMMGHKSVNTTMIYAKMVDEQRKKAINSIPNISELEK